MKRQWTSDELIDEWTLTPDEERLLRNKVGATRLGFAVLLKYFQHEHRFPERKQDAPTAVVAYLAKQLHVTPELYLRYSWDGRSIKEHRAQIRAALGYRSVTVRDADDLVVWLQERVLAREHRLERLEEALRAECRARGLEPPTSHRLMRLLRSAIHGYEQAFFARTWARLSSHSRTRLHALLIGVTRSDEHNEPGSPATTPPDDAPAREPASTEDVASDAPSSHLSDTTWEEQAVEAALDLIERLGDADLDADPANQAPDGAVAESTADGAT